MVQRVRAVASMTLATVMAIGFAGCSDSDPETTVETFNPCDLLDADALANAIDSNVVVNEGSSDSPACTLIPVEEGKAALDVNYMAWSNLADAWATIDAPGLRYSSPKIGDGARVVVEPEDDMLTITGYVESDGKVYVVNALKPAPYEVKQLRSAVLMALHQLAGDPT